MVVPGTIPTRLPPRSTTLSMPDASVVRRLPPSRKVAIVKSTSVCRDSEAVVEPHSMSMVPSTTALIRFAGDTLTHFSRSSGRARSFWTVSAIFRQRSTEYPAGLPSSPVNENGHDESRYPSVIVFVSLMRFSVPSGPAAAAGAADMTTSITASPTRLITPFLRWRARSSTRCPDESSRPAERAIGPWSQEGEGSRPSVCGRGSWRPLTTARRTASRRMVSSNGLVMNSTAPPFSACAAIAESP